MTWLQSGTSWVYAGGVWTCTPAYSSTLIGGETVDGNMEDTDDADPLVWIASGSPTTRVKDTSIYHSGNRSIHLVTSSSAGARNYNNTSVGLYRVEGYFYLVSGAAQVNFTTSNTTNDKYCLSAVAPTNEWTKFVGVTPERAVGSRALYLNGVGATEVYYDDVSAYKLDLPSCLLTQNVGTEAYVTVAMQTNCLSAVGGVNVSGRIGVCGCINSYTTPTYGIFAYGIWAIGTYYLSMDKLINGVWTNIYAPTAAPFDVKARIGLQISNGHARLFYGDILVTDIDVSAEGASLLGNTYWGAISSQPEITLDEPIIELAARTKGSQTTINDSATQYAYAPGLTKLNSDNLFIIYGRGSSSEVNLCDLVYRISTDGPVGATWGAEVVEEKWTHAYDGAGYIYNNPEVKLLNNGTLFVSYAKMYNSASNAHAMCRIATVDSSDALTWGNPITISSTSNDRCTSGKVIELSNGNLIVFSYSGVGDIYCNISTDHGATWGADVAVYTASSSYSEAQAIELPSGRIICFMRGSNTTDSKGVYRCYSDDGGATWGTAGGANTVTKVIPITTPGRASIIRLQNGTLLYAGRGDHTANYEYVCWGVSTDTINSGDDGSNWVAPMYKNVSLPSQVKVSGYSSPIQYGDQSIGIAICYQQSATQANCYYARIINRDWLTYNRVALGLTGAMTGGFNRGMDGGRS